ncbi:MAG: hypothetical protein O7E56_13890 [SAR324 cluster bacterium]|nr:hypothetical protein [SAR324 cluster bacterium]
MIEPKAIIENEAFVALMAVAKEDFGIRSKLLGLLSLDSFNRKSALNTFVEEMRLRQASRKFINAIAYLLDDRIAAEALNFLREKLPDAAVGRNDN